METSSYQAATEGFIKKMIFFRKVRRKLYKGFHPAMGEVWMLHRVIPENQRSQEKSLRDLEVTPEFLETKILEYKKKGYKFVSIDQVNDTLSHTTIHSYFPFFKKREPFICITLDDGYADNFLYAYPLFKKYNVPFAIYITTGFVEKTAPMWWYKQTPNTLDWEQLRMLSQDAMCTIGAHCISHPMLGKTSLSQAQQEIANSKKILEERLHTHINHFSYPHGDYNSVVLRIVQDCGFQTAVLVWGGKVRPGQHCLEIPRIHIKM